MCNLNLKKSQKKLRVMTFNIWLSGNRVENGLEKIAYHIKKVDPDIVALQEIINNDIVPKLIAILGEPWTGVHHESTYPDTAILTKHTFVNEPSVRLHFHYDENEFEKHKCHSEVVYGTGATIQLADTGSLVNFFSMHLYYRSYGPYAANNKLVTNAEMIMAGERNTFENSRAQNIEGLLKNERFKEFLARSDMEPLIVAGDFNCPSHQDWIEENKDLHGGWVIEWPATKLMTDAGFIDSYRHLHPDAIKDPGITWSTVQKKSGVEWDYTIPEPQDRIDFIFYRGPKDFEPISSHLYSGDEPLKLIPYEWKNPYPSDHYAVITEFTCAGDADQ